MINEETLDEWEQATREVFADTKPTTGTAAAIAQTNLDQYLDVIRLARLGLWAERHGVPTFEKIRAEDMREAVCPNEKPGISCGVYHRESGPLGAAAGMALAALPKETP